MSRNGFCFECHSTTYNATILLAKLGDFVAHITVPLYTFFSYFLASTFIFQWLYDETQLALDGSGLPKSLKGVTPEQVKFIMMLGRDLKHSLRQINVQ